MSSSLVKESLKKPKLNDSRPRKVHTKEKKKKKTFLNLLAVKKLISPESSKKEIFSRVQKQKASVYNRESSGENIADDNSKHFASASRRTKYEHDFTFENGSKRKSIPTKSHDKVLKSTRDLYFRELSPQTENVGGVNYDKQCDPSGLISADKEMDEFSVHMNSDSHLAKEKSKQKKRKKRHKDSEGNSVRHAKTNELKSSLSDDEFHRSMGEEAGLNEKSEEEGLTSQNQGTEKEPKCNWNVGSTNCGESFSHSSLKTEASIATHEKDEADMGRFSCPKCHKVFWKKNHLTSHKKLHMVPQIFSCPVCKKPYHSKSRLGAHLRAHPTMEKVNLITNYFQTSGPIEQTIDGDETQFPDLGALAPKTSGKDLNMVGKSKPQDDQKHVDENDFQNTEIKCDAIDFVHSTEVAQVTPSTKLKYKLRKYGMDLKTSEEARERCSKITEMKCPVCSKNFLKVKKLWKHVSNSHRSLESTKTEMKTLQTDLETGEKENICKTNEAIVEEKIDDKVLVSQYLDSIKGKCSKIYGCAICERYLSTKMALVNHLIVHQSTKPFICSICGASFTTKASVINHEKVHAGDKSLTCFHCDKTFLRKYHLRIHMKVHEEEKGFVCPVCRKAFRFKTGLSAHLNIHTDKVFSCNVCGKTCNNQSGMIRHKKTHLDVRKFSCGECDKKFSQFSHLKEHLRLHTDVKPYSCSICKKKFKQSSHLSVHQATHTKERPFQCVNCKRSYTQSCHLARHIVNCRV